MTPTIPTIDAYVPREIARKIEALGVPKARSDTLSLLVLAALAGALLPWGPSFSPWWRPTPH